VSGQDIVIALILGVLLPALLSRPALLTAHPMREHVRRRWNIGYTMFAFAGASYVYTTALTLLKPSGGFSTSAQRAVSGAGGLIFLLLCINHLPPILDDRRSRLSKTLQAVGSIVCGVFAGGFLAIDELLSVAHTSTISYVSWAIVLVAMFGLAFWYGPSPEDRLLVFRVVRRLRRFRQHRRDRAKNTTGIPSSSRR
jgi:drug/metabolite transporter (DMT)-like permease